MKKLQKLTLKQLENEMTVIGSDEQRAMFGGSRLVGSDIWWTQSECDNMINIGTWSGGYVDGMGYVTQAVNCYSASGSQDATASGEYGYSLLSNLFWHYQFGGKGDFNMNASSLDFGGATQSQLGLSGMTIGEDRPVNLFNLGINPTSLVLGNIRVVYEGNNQFSILTVEFNFEYRDDGTWERTAGTFIGGAVFGQFMDIPITPYSVIRNAIGLGG